MSKYVKWWDKSPELSSKQVAFSVLFVVMLLVLFASADLTGNQTLLNIKNNFGYVLGVILVVMIVMDKIRGKK